ncbi:hypothetical protein HKX48_001496, partial [Thoreauomyces humboldtii]
VKTDAQQPLKVMTRLVSVMGLDPQIAAIYTSPAPIGDLIVNTVTLSKFLNMKDANDLDFAGCVQATWRAGYGLENNPGWDADPDTQSVYNSTNTTFAQYAWGLALQNPFNATSNSMAIYDNSTGGKLVLYTPDPYTRIPDPASGRPVGIATQLIPYLGLMTLGLVEPVPDAFFNVNNKFEIGLTVGVIGQQFWKHGTAYPDDPPTFACMAGAKIATTWIRMLRAAKPMPDAVVAMFDSRALAVLASSNMIVDSTVNSTAKGLVYAQPKVDAESMLFQRLMASRYAVGFDVQSGVPDIQKAVDVVQKEPRYELEVNGKKWIIAVDIVSLGNYDYCLLMLAVPRTEVYGVIDSASTRARILSIAISVTAATFVTAIFILAVLPLATLVRQMKLLTSLDFTALETSAELDVRSWVWELRVVQDVFGPMVKAFAVAIKQNTAMMRTQNGIISSKRSRPTMTSSTTGPGEPLTGAAIVIVDFDDDDEE